MPDPKWDPDYDEATAEMDGAQGPQGVPGEQGERGPRGPVGGSQ